jgi:alpha-tubulin suppressor-like RCC1 family protein
MHMQVPGAVNIASIACGAFHNMALVADGRVLAWGTNDYGQLGNGSTIYSTTPVEVRAVWRSVSAAVNATVAAC